MWGYVVYYEKSNGQTIERIRTSLPEKRIGDYTSMGWLIKDIKYIYDGKIYDTKEQQSKAIKKKYFVPDLMYKIKKVAKSHIWQVFFMLYTSTITAYIILKV